MDKKTEKLFQKELKIPCHLNHIADRVLKVPKSEAQDIIEMMLTNGTLEESTFAKNYYNLKTDV